MTRIRVGAKMPALLFLTPLAGVAVVYGCIPNPDISGLPPFDAGSSVLVTPDATVQTGEDASTDAVVPPTQEASAVDSPVDTGPGTGTITGVVIDYTQGNGHGVVPGATVSIVTATGTGQTTTTDLNGVFTLPNVPSGSVQIAVSKSTDPNGTVAYSTTQAVVALGSGQTLSVFPALHEGCFEVVTAGQSNVVTLQDSTSTCRQRTGAYAKMMFGNASFKNPNGALYTGPLRVEMIPLAYPSGGSFSPDLSWAIGLPGSTSPIDTLGAVEYRVVVHDPGQADDGSPLVVAVTDGGAGAVLISVPLFRTVGGTEAALLQADSFNAATGQWTTEAVTVGPPSQMNPGDAGNIEVVSLAVPHLEWWSVTLPNPGTTCMTGKVELAGTGVGGVWVRSVGTNYLGATGALTDSTGSFCLDGVKTTSDEDGGAAQVQIFAGAITANGPAIAPPTFDGVSNLTGGTCASGNCTVSQPIDLQTVGTCAAGTLTPSGSDIPPAQLAVELVEIPGVDYAKNAGITSSAYVGVASLNAGGSFCAIVPNNPFQLQNFDASCPTATVPATLGLAAACSVTGAGCADAGSLSYTCGPPP